MDHGFLAKIDRLALNASLGEMFRDFEYLVNSMKNESQPPPIAEILSAFQPKNDLEKLFKVKLIDKFRCASAVDDLIRGEDSFYVSKILQCSWYFEDIDNVTVLVNEAMPSMSLFTRTKLINAYARHLKDSRKGDDMFLAIRERYGLSKALIILPSCSEPFVRHQLRFSHIQPPGGVMIELYEKYPMAVVEFMENLMTVNVEYNKALRNFQKHLYSGVFHKMASQETKIFMSFYEKYHGGVPYLSFGKPLIRKLIKTNLTSLIENFNVYSRILKKNIFVKFLSLDQIKQLQRNIFPGTMAEFFKSRPTDTFLAVTSHLKPEIARNILRENFRTSFGREFSVEEFISVIHFRMLGFLSAEERIKWVEAAVANESNLKKRAEFIAELEVAESFPRLKKMAEKTSDLSARSCIIRNMVKSVRKNKAMDSFAEIIGYIVDRYRNDNVQIRCELIDELREFEKLLFELTEPGWAVVITFVNQVRMNGELDRFLFYIEKILSHRIQGSFMKGQDVEQHLEFYCDIVLKANSHYSFHLCKGTPYRKQCLEWFCTKLPKITVTSVQEKELHKNLFVNIYHYNAKSKDRVKIPDWLKQSVEQELKSDNCFYWKRCILDAGKHDFEHKSWICGILFPRSCDPDVVAFILKTQPLAIKANAKKVVKAVANGTFSDYRPLIKRMRFYSAFGVPQSLVEECRVVLNKDEEYLPFSKPNAVQVLSHLMPPKDFFEIAQEFVPTSDRVGDYSEEVAALTSMQEAVAKSIKNVENPSLFLSLIRQFSKGDYLKFVVGTINSISNRIPEGIILPQIIEWLDCPVSLRKHFIRAFSAIAPLENTSKLLASLFEKERNTSIRLVIFNRMFSMFAVEPNESMFRIFKSFLMTLTPEDNEVMGTLLEVNKVADVYISQYYEMLWELSELKGNELGSKFRNDIICSINNNILDLLSDEFCETIMRHAFSRPILKSGFHVGLNFSCDYLLFRHSETQEKRLIVFRNHLTNAFTESWNEYNLLESSVFPARQAVVYLVNTLTISCFKLKKSQSNPLELFIEIKKTLQAFSDRSHLLAEFIRLDFAIFYHENGLGSSCRISPELVAQFLQVELIQLFQAYGSLVVPFVKEALPLDLLQVDLLRLIEILLTEYSDESSHVVAVSMLPRDLNPKTNVELYKKIVESIMHSQYISVQLLGHTLFKNMTSSIRVV